MSRDQKPTLAVLDKIILSSWEAETQGSILLFCWILIRIIDLSTVVNSFSDNRTIKNCAALRFAVPLIYTVG